MQIIINHLGKRFNQDWLFRGFSKNFSIGSPCAITGPNGSGKSTLLQILAGMIPASEGTIKYQAGGNDVSSDYIYQHISYTAPSQELIEEFTLRELLDFHLNFKNFSGDISRENFSDKVMIGNTKNKPIRFFSSGMKQRIKLGLSLYSDTQLLMLDEPMANLDKAGTEWYRNEIALQINKRLIIICSNHKEEYECCTEEINLQEIKKVSMP